MPASAGAAKQLLAFEGKWVSGHHRAEVGRRGENLHDDQRGGEPSPAVEVLLKWTEAKNDCEEVR